MPKKPDVLTGDCIEGYGKKSGDRRRERGAAYVLALVAMLTGLTLSLALLSSANGHFLGEASRKSKDAARYLAEAGIDYVAWQLDVGGVFLPYEAVVDLDSGSFHVLAVDDSARDAGTAYVECTGTAGGCTYTIKKVINGQDEIIMDNPAGTAVGVWSTGTSSADKYGPNYRWRSTNPAYTEQFIWTPNIPTAGGYEVYGWWCQGGNRSTQAPFLIYYNGGNTTVRVNQQINGGRWNSLGIYQFNAGTSGTVRVGAAAPSGSVVVADGIRLVRRN